MKVILREDVDKLGRLGRSRGREVRLWPQLPAAAAVGVPRHARRRKSRSRLKSASFCRRELKKVEELKELAVFLNGRSVTISARAQEEKLYGSVGADEIAAGDPQGAQGHRAAQRGHRRGAVQDAGHAGRAAETSRPTPKPQ